MNGNRFERAGEMSEQAEEQRSERDICPHVMRNKLVNDALESAVYAGWRIYAIQY